MITHLPPAAESVWSEPPPDALTALHQQQQIAYARDFQRIYRLERARRHELETANAELARRCDDLIAAQDWILALNSCRALPDLLDHLTQPLVLLLGVRGVAIFPCETTTGQLLPGLGHGVLQETPPLAALRVCALSQRLLAAGRPWEACDLALGDAPDDELTPEDREPLRLLGWRAVAALPLLARNQQVGLLYVGWAHAHQPDERERALLDLLAQHTAASLSNAQLLRECDARAEALARAEAQLMAYARDVRRAYADERARRHELQEAYVATVRVLAAAIETRDPYTGGHIERVASYSVAIGRELHWSAEQLYILELGALLHDVGKIGTADHILLKAGRLTTEEWQRMREHPATGARMLQHVPFLKPSLGCVLYHHERLDGQGYPHGLAGDAIPVEARVVTVADAFDAMTTHRPYRRALTVEAALEELRRCTGSQFDPQVVAAFQRAAASGAIASD